MSRRVAGSRLLINEYPLQVLPSLAVALGLNEAIFIQQVHYWLVSSKHEHDGHLWVYNTLDEWQKQFPFWSISTLRRTIDNLRENGVLLTGNYNETAANRTLWYSIDYDLLDQLDPSVEINNPSVQSEQMETSKMDNPSVQSEQMLKEAETTTETTQRGGGVAPPSTDAAAAVDQTVITRLVNEVRLTRKVAIQYATLHAFTDSEIDRLIEWCKVKRSEGKNPAAILTSQYAPHGDLPDDLPAARRIDAWPHRPDGSIDTDRLNELARRNPGIMTNRWVYQ